MTQTVYGILCDRDGLASTTVLEQGPLRPELRFKAWATASSEIRPVQAARIPVDRDHNGIGRGELVYLERDRHGRLWAVGHVDDRVSASVDVRVGDRSVSLEHDLFWSVRRSPFPSDIVIDSVALTAASARITPQPVKFMPGSLDYRRQPPSGWKLDPDERALLQRACEAHRARRRGDPLIVHDVTPSAEHHNGLAVRTAPPLEIRSAEQVGVSTTTRTIEIVVAPYNEPANVHHGGRWIREIYTRGSFDGVAEQTNRCRVNRDHDRQRTVGRAVAFYPHREEGLVAELKIAQTALGDESLALAADDCLSASAGFRCLEERWQGRDTRLVAKAWLDHIALVPEPAYETADVLAVRATH